ncbi:winged helix-turn-helix domain-containing protein (plasmid) [Entomospira entomophila]|uniref:Winged helix-turn-helix transcriptional regulator n=1 Tax=Entomospira entomophila TaxID=2719988 RepID=A0A968GAC9_9SPIO|nr:winged helix-turn-helix domain-containing protein [Entomospira entomophilus]NIZ41538.1 winged helix-turn-helix transcriptional regulator [Entomospira entomophilus]WDI36434.1 winged helix-turn-helix domain-containing protein [Entomospira entomophilus]
MMLSSSAQSYTLSDYQYGFTQPYPAYGVKDANGWRTVHQPLTKSTIQAHLNHQISVGTFGRWYPRYGIIDIDDVELSNLYEIRSRLGMHDGNSAIFTSESRKSYHIYFKPTRKGKMLNLNLYLKCMASARESLKIEIYPQAHHLIRLPFGKGQHHLDNGIAWPLSYQEGMELFHTMGEYDVDQLPYLPMVAEEFAPSENLLEGNFGIQKGWKRDGLILINEGLQSDGTRLESLKRVIYFYWSQNLPMEATVRLTQQWMETKHNQHSKDYRQHPQRVNQQIIDLTQWIYNHFDRSYTLPDSAHIVDKGYLTKELTQTLVVASQGRLPILKFGLQLFAYLSPRNTGKNKISVHRDRLVEWSSTKNYLQYIDHFKQQGLLKRDARYKVGHYAKGISLLQGYTSFDRALQLEEDRPASGLHEIIPMVYTPHDYAKQLQTINVERSQIRKQINEIYGKEKPAEVRTKKATTQQRIQEYLQKHPQATQQEIAKSLNINQSTISRNMKN